MNQLIESYDILVQHLSEGKITYGELMPRLPFIANKYQKKAYELAKQKRALEDTLDEWYNQKFIAVRSGVGKESYINTNANELKTLLTTHEDYRKAKVVIDSMEVDIKRLEEIIDMLKQLHWYASLKIKWKETYGC
jgi:hypothetical protein